MRIEAASAAPGYWRKTLPWENVAILTAMSSPTSSLAIGQQLQSGRYVIQNRLGHGRFGVTYLAEEPGTGQKWVLKTLNLDLMAALSPDELSRLREMFYQEAVKLAKCQHPHIVRVGMPFEEGGQVYVPMEYVDGRSLAERATKTLTEPVALEYIRQIGEALAVVHGHKLVHRDVQPGNILLRLNGNRAEAVLIDFGLALDFDHALTTTRAKQVSEGFTPPELCTKGQKVGAYSDVYGLAATLYQLLTGETPPGAYARKVNQQRLVPPKELNAEISERTNRVILEGMALEPRERSQSVQAWLKALGVAQPQAATPEQTKKEVNWTKWGVFWAAVAAIAGLLAAAPALIGMLPKAPQPTPTVTATPKVTQTP